MLSLQKNRKVHSRHYKNTLGGLSGHLFRRVVHLCMAVVPFLYYRYVNASEWLWLILGLTIILEAIRLKSGWIVFGQREMEKKKISSMASGIFGMCLVLIIAKPFYAIPIIISCAIVDPIVGELRGTRLHPAWIWIIGIIAVAWVWALCHLWLHTPLWLTFVMAPLIVILERPNISWLDDNLLMLLGPLLLVSLG